MTQPVIDWSGHDKYSEHTNTCRCGAVFRSHAKFVMDKCRMVTRKPCPACGRDDDLSRCESDSEVETLRAGDVAELPEPPK
jgi:hypothetical protein